MESAVYHGSKCSLMESHGSLRAFRSLMKMERASRKSEARSKFSQSGFPLAILNPNTISRVLRKKSLLDLI